MARLLPFLKMDTVLIISSWPTGLYDYVQYMQMQSICIVIAYADGKYMRMPHLCRCPAYGYVEPMLYSLFSRSDPKKASSGSASAPPGSSGPETQYLAVFSAGCNAICCVPALPRYPARGSGFWRFAYSLTVVHFRKLRKARKVGSGRNGRPVI
ncbi:hypothetical protein RZP29_28190 [Klebsiella quasipneumoniae subsp. similipneumoniae]|uniref:Uncharacterized protein n=1 Tax=Klebsiella quasipneumoniae subsp. similipneumoniae TaxID=1463164 RepID=A0AAE4SIE1_9ENTR|nr:hypothetical protein [Klebsiella quasipneumoniae]MDV0614379.1 hypothetical protein [Klebsiella quasipneumoniae subsp. similipneumoniae]MDV0642140.1 hypothetical protein [Klebsiella quasipneumoniae subsp. similipneumoniae]MDV0729286.1 hypothetical protein [Klebsiella quasipneumoniae subsp. similipneumoniae]MDV0740687.1 hypothetical protein [Klebsiella quasipneumoniae subsp. similipneumoniae]MDV0766635.1 hypothetical protein [Klebsiella quasipneumoniae subsp. similipneumoniae]